MAHLAEKLEAEARDLLADGFAPERALALLRDALALRDAAQASADPDVIWTLSLLIEAHLRRHTREDAEAAAQLGERRLAARRVALSGAPEELVRTLEETAELYMFEYDALDAPRAEALRREARARAAGAP